MCVVLSAYHRGTLGVWVDWKRVHPGCCCLNVSELKGFNSRLEKSAVSSSSHILSALFNEDMFEEEMRRVRQKNVFLCTLKDSVFPLGINKMFSFFTKNKSCGCLSRVCTRGRVCVCSTWGQAGQRDAAELVLIGRAVMTGKRLTGAF